MRSYFKSVKKKIVAALLAMSLTAGSVAFAEMPEIMKLSEIQPGMSGTAYTVIDPSNELEPIDVDVVAVIDSSKMDDARILVKLSGATIDKTGGILSGMSGSPVYIDGKLIGALSANFKEVHMDNALITPIEAMLKIWDMPDKKNKTEFKQINLQQALKDNEKDYAELEKKLEKVEKQLEALKKDRTSEQAEADELAPAKDAKPAADAAAKTSTTPAEPDKKDGSKAAASKVQEKAVLMAYGFGERGFEYLQERLERHGIRAMDGSSVSAGHNDVVRTNASLRPGDAMGVAAVLGDFSLGAYGTVTAVDDKRILAFGHPFTHRGNVNYFLTGSKVLATVNGPLNGMKLSETDGIIGRINQDRNAGVGGVLGMFPQSVPISVTVHDLDLGTDSTYYAYMAYDEEVMTELVSGVAYAAIDKSVDRLNDSTATVKFAIRTNAVDSGKIERRNMYYDAKDVGKTAISELKDFMTVISANKERESDITDVKVDVVIEPKRMTASLISAVPSKQEVEPGETITFKTTIKPYRGEKVILNVPLTIPEGQPAGQLKLDMHGGGLVNVTKALLVQQAKAIEEAKADATNEDENNYTTSEILEDGMDSPRNNDIVTEASVNIITTEEEQAQAIKEAKKLAEKLKEQKKQEETAKAAAGDNGEKTAKKAKHPKLPTYPTNYIIDNVIRTSITVVEPDPEKAKAKEQKKADAKKAEADKKKEKLELGKAANSDTTIKLGEGINIDTGAENGNTAKSKDAARTKDGAAAKDKNNDTNTDNNTDKNTAKTVKKA